MMSENLKDKLHRKNIMVEDNVWKSCEILSKLQNKSISKVINEFLKNELRKQQENNVALRINMALENLSYVSEEEEEDIMKTLSELKPEDLEIAPLEKI